MSTTQQAIDFVIIGGFLGAGKTTLTTRLSELLQQRGRRVGIVTNDQASGLVDTRVASLTELPVAEVAGGCFCCRFDDLLEQAESVGVQGVDVVLTEPVGSCTDLVATVYEPLRRNFKDRWRLAPFTVVVDPHRAAEYLGAPGATKPGPESSDMAFLFHKQLEEAELIVLNKVDTLASDQRESLLQLLRSNFQASAVLPVSAKTGEGLQTLLKALSRPAGDLSHRILSIDYARYAAAEAALGWLNATLRFESKHDFDANALIADWFEGIRALTQAKERDIAHLKLWAASGSEAFRVSLTGVRHPLRWDGRFSRPLRSLAVTVNARIALLPDELEKVVCEKARELANERGVECWIDEMACFQPAEPRPTHRVTAELA